MPSRGGSASVLTAALSSGGTSVNSILSAAILSEVCASLAFCGACWHAARHNPAVRSTIRIRSEEHTSELQSLMRISYAVFCLKKNKLIYTPSRSISHQDGSYI